MPAGSRVQIQPVVLIFNDHRFLVLFLLPPVMYPNFRTFILTTYPLEPRGTKENCQNKKENILDTVHHSE